MNSHKVVVLGDGEVGKTTLCHRLEDPYVPIAQQWPANIEYFHFSAPTAATEAEDQDSVNIQLVDQPGADRFSLQPIVFRKAAGVVILVDAHTVYQEFVEEAVSQSASPASASASSSHFFHPSASVGWQTFLKESIVMWTTVVNEESQYCRDRERARLPCVVVFSKMDMLPSDDEATVAAFKSECRMRCLQPDIRADDVFFLDVVHADAVALQSLRTSIGTLVYEKIVKVCLALQQGPPQTVRLNAPNTRSVTDVSHNKKSCCNR